MKPEDQVCTVEQAKKLKELGVPQESYLYWWFHYRLGNDRIFSIGQEDEADKVNEKWSAFTVSELADIVGRGTLAADYHWQWLTELVNSGCSGTAAYNPIALAGFVITQIEIGNIKFKQ